MSREVEWVPTCLERDVPMTCTRRYENASAQHSALGPKLHPVLYIFTNFIALYTQSFPPAPACTMNELDLHYPPDLCPFCSIAAAFPIPTTPYSTAQSLSELGRCVPTDEDADPEKTKPSSFIVLASPDVVAFLDILPMTKGHLLVASREHRVKVQDLKGEEGRSIGNLSY